MTSGQIAFVVFAAISLTATVIYFIVIYRNQKRRLAQKPSRHRGEYRTQKGRAYDPGVSYRSNSGEGYAGAGKNLVSLDPAYRALSGDPKDRAEASRKSREFVLRASADQSDGSSTS